MSIPNWRDIPGMGDLPALREGHPFLTAVDDLINEISQRTRKRLEGAEALVDRAGERITSLGASSVTGNAQGHSYRWSPMILIPYDGSSRTGSRRLHTILPETFLHGPQIIDNARLHREHLWRDTAFLTALLGLYDPFDPERNNYNLYASMTVGEIFRAAGVVVEDPEPVTNRGGTTFMPGGFMLLMPHTGNQAQLQGRSVNISALPSTALMPINFKETISHRMHTYQGYTEIGWTLSLRGNATVGEFTAKVNDELQPVFESFSTSVGGMRFSSDGQSITFGSRNASVSFDSSGNIGAGTVSTKVGNVKVKVEVKHTPWISYIKVETESSAQLERVFTSSRSPLNARGETPETTITATMFAKFVYFRRRRSGDPSPIARPANVHTFFHAWEGIVKEETALGSGTRLPFGIPDHIYTRAITAALNNEISTLNLMIAAAAGVLATMLVVAIVKAGPAAATAAPIAAQYAERAFRVVQQAGSQWAPIAGSQLAPGLR